MSTAASSSAAAQAPRAANNSSNHYVDDNDCEGSELALPPPRVYSGSRLMGETVDSEVEDEEAGMRGALNDGNAKSSGDTRVKTAPHFSDRIWESYNLSTRSSASPFV